MRDTPSLPASRGRGHTAVLREMRNHLPNTTQKEPVGQPLRGSSRARSREKPGRPGPPPPPRCSPSDPRIGEGCLPDRGASLCATPKLSRHAQGGTPSGTVVGTLLWGTPPHAPPPKKQGGSRMARMAHERARDYPRGQLSGGCVQLSDFQGPLANGKPHQRASESHSRWLSRPFNIFHRKSILFR